jgi:hypothetical protein
MRVEITAAPGIFTEGSLERLLAEQGTPYPHIVIEIEGEGSKRSDQSSLDLPSPLSGVHALLSV